MSQNGIFSIHCFQSDKEISLLKTKEKVIRSSQGNKDEIIDYAVVIECLNVNKVKKFLSITKLAAKAAITPKSTSRKVAIKL